MADSDPAAEHDECANKMAALEIAIDRGRDGDLRAVRVLVIDNYDSFTYNLVDYIASAGAEVRVERNDAIDADEAAGWEPTPRRRLPRARARPAEAGVSAAVIERLAGRVPCSASASATR